MSKEPWFYIRACSPEKQYFVAGFDPDKGGYYLIKIDKIGDFAVGCCGFKTQNDAVMGIYKLIDCPMDYETVVVCVVPEDGVNAPKRETAKTEKNFLGGSRKIAKGHNPNRSRRFSNKKKRK